MLLKQNLTLYRVLKMTWKFDLLIISLCIASYLIDKNFLKNIHIPPFLPTLAGTAIAFFIAFNNNQAYSRWWEARIIWGGLVNDSRSWARAVLAYTDESTNTEQLTATRKKLILRHIGFLYALKDSLRRVRNEDYKKYMSAEEASAVAQYSNMPNAILDMQASDLMDLQQKQVVDGFRFLALNDMIVNFCDGMGKSERINNTVFPTTYIYFTKLFTLLLVVMTTSTLAETINGWSILFGWIIGFVFHATHVNGINIMNPFELTPTCVPLNSIVRSIEINLLQAMGEKELPAPEPVSERGDYIL